MSTSQSITIVGAGSGRGMRNTDGHQPTGDEARPMASRADEDECGCERLDNGECGCLSDRLAREAGKLR